MQESAGIAAPDSSLGSPGNLVDASASQSLHTTITDRALVVVRGHRARVERITPYAQCAVVHLTPIDRDGSPPAVIVPFDRLTPVESARNRWCRTRTTVLVGALAHDIVSSGVPAPLARYPSRLAVPAWQLSVARAFDAGIATRVLLSDAVGLGKTVQTGFAIATLRLHQPAARVLIACPAGLRDQWRGELGDLFGIEPASIDAASIRTWRYQLPAGVNVWQVPAVALTSIDFLKQPAVWAEALEAPWDLLIVDEAHHVTPGSDRHAAIAGLAARAAFVLLITATPHAGGAADFAALCRIGAVEPDSDAMLLVRRARADVGLDRARRVAWHRVTMSSHERELHDALLTYASRVWRASAGDAQAPRLAMTLLMKRAGSSHEALLRSLRHRLNCLAGRGSAGHLPVQIALPLVGDGEVDDADDAHPQALAAPGLTDVVQEVEALERLIELASRCRERGDSKLATLSRLVARLREPVIVFTEYRATLDAALERLPSVAPVTAMHGGMDRHARLAAVRDLADGRVRVLIATDVASEGLNLHSAARTVIHLELPWTPAVVEQRVGRVDRIGQQRTVHVHHLVWKSPLEGDVLRRLVKRAADARHALGDDVPDWLTLGAGVLGIAPQVAADAPQPASAFRSWTPSHDVDLLCRVRALELLKRLESRTGRRRSSRRSACPVIRVHRMPRDPWAHSVVIVYRLCARARSGQVAAQVVIPVRVEFNPVALTRSSCRVLLRAADQVAAARALDATPDLLRPPVERFQQRMRAAGRRAQAIHARVAAEAAEGSQQVGLTQPGLFDRRALALAARRKAIVQTAAARAREVLVLESAALDVQLPDTAEPIGALIVP
jgi:superfamily II DNA or RNA helicase